MNIELRNYFIIIVVILIAITFFSIRKKLRTVIVLVILFLFMAYKATSLQNALDYAKTYIKQTNGLALDQTDQQKENEDDNTITLPMMEYYDTSNGTE